MFGSQFGVRQRISKCVSSTVIFVRKYGRLIFNVISLHRYIRRYVYAYEPRDLEIKWKFIPEYRDAGIVSDYRLQDRSMFTPSTASLRFLMDEIYIV